MLYRVERRQRGKERERLQGLAVFCMSHFYGQGTNKIKLLPKRNIRMRQETRHEEEGDRLRRVSCGGGSGYRLQLPAACLMANLPALLLANTPLCSAFCLTRLSSLDFSCCVIYILFVCEVTSVLCTDSFASPRLTTQLPFGHLPDSLHPLSGFLLRSLWLQFAQMSR